MQLALSFAVTYIVQIPSVEPLSFYYSGEASNRIVSAKELARRYPSKAKAEEDILQQHLKSELRKLLRGREILVIPIDA